MRHNKNINFIFSLKVKIFISMCAIIFQYNLALAKSVGIEVTPTSALTVSQNDVDYLYVHPYTYYASSTVGACVKIKNTANKDINIKNGIIVAGTLDGFHDKSKKLTTSASPGLLITSQSLDNLLSNVEIIGYISGSPALSIGAITKQNRGGFSGTIINRYSGTIESSTTAIYVGIYNSSTTTEKVKFINRGRISGAIIVKSMIVPNTSTFSLKNEGEIIASDIICQDLTNNKVYGHSSMENNGRIILGNATTVASTLCVGKIINNGQIIANSKLIITGAMQLENNNKFAVNKEINVGEDVTLKNCAYAAINIHGSATFNNKTINNGYFIIDQEATITKEASFINQRNGEFYSVNKKLIVNGKFTNSGKFISTGELVVNKQSEFINHKSAAMGVNLLLINDATINTSSDFVVNEISGSGVINAQYGLVKIVNAITKGASVDIINTNSVVELESFSTIHSYNGKGNNVNELVINLPKKLPQASSALVNIIKAATFTTNNKIVLATDSPLLYIEKTPKKFTILQANTISVDTPNDLLYSRVYHRASNDDLNAQIIETLHSRTVLINITDVKITSTKITANLQYTDLAIYQTDSTNKLTTSLLYGRLAKATNTHPKLKKYNNTGIEASRKSDQHMDTILNVIPNSYQGISVSNQKLGVASGENSPFKIIGSVFFNYANEKQAKGSDYKRKFYGNNIALGVEYQVPQTTFSFFTLYSKTKFTNEGSKSNTQAKTTHGSDKTILDSYSAILSITKPVNNFDIASSIVYDRTKHRSGHFPDFFSTSYSLALISTYKYDTGYNKINLGLASQLTLVQTPKHYNDNFMCNSIERQNNKYFCISPFIAVIDSYKFMTSNIITTVIKAGYLYINDMQNNKKDEQVEIKSSDNSFMLDVQHQHIKHKLYVAFAANMSVNSFFYDINFRWKHDSETNTLDIKASIAYKL